MGITPKEIQEIARGKMGVKIDTRRAKYRKFKANFCFTPPVVAIAWNKLLSKRLLPKTAEPKHLLWFLHWVKYYPTKDKAETDCRCNRDTFSDWVVRIGHALVDLNMVSSSAILSGLGHD